MLGCVKRGTIPQGVTPRHRLEEAHRKLPSGAVYSGSTAAWLHGLDNKLEESIEVTVSPPLRVWPRRDLVVRRCMLANEELVTICDVRVTSVPRTLLDLCARLSLTESLVYIDTALHRRLATIGSLKSYVEAHGGAGGIAIMRRALGHAEPKSESPMETRLRMLLVLSRLPRPEAQVAIHDRAGLFVGRPDLFYRESHLGIEYDGNLHRESLAEDDRRQNRLLSAGVRLLRFTATDIYQRPRDVVAQVRRLLTT
jgi:very-short-patch-repair endonuclease